jgi:hypothetical protein
LKFSSKTKHLLLIWIKKIKQIISIRVIAYFKIECFKYWARVLWLKFLTKWNLSVFIAFSVGEKLGIVVWLKILFEFNIAVFTDGIILTLDDSNCCCCCLFNFAWFLLALLFVVFICFWFIYDIILDMTLNSIVFCLFIRNFIQIFIEIQDQKLFGLKNKKKQKTNSIKTN